MQRCSKFACGNNRFAATFIEQLTMPPHPNNIILQHMADRVDDADKGGFVISLPAIITSKTHRASPTMKLHRVWEGKG